MFTHLSVQFLSVQRYEKISALSYTPHVIHRFLNTKSGILFIFTDQTHKTDCNMNREIERKFRVVNDLYKSGSTSCLYKQGYLCTDKERTVRIRIAGEKGYITIKGRTTGCSRAEYEYENTACRRRLDARHALRETPHRENTLPLYRPPTARCGRSTSFSAKTRASSWPKSNSRAKTNPLPARRGWATKLPATPATTTPTCRKPLISDGRAPGASHHRPVRGVLQAPSTACHTSSTRMQLEESRK